MKNYYEILEIDKNATKEEIKSSYRKKILQYHPDRNNNFNSEEITKEINEAFRILSNKNKRDKYDRDILDKNISNFVKSNGNFYSNMSSFFYNSSYNTELDIKNYISITLKDALKGGTSIVTFDRILECDTCCGKGWNNLNTKCKTCNGLGQINNISNCTDCKNTGLEIETCSVCLGTKTIVKRENITIKIPPITKENLLSNEIQLKFNNYGNSIYTGTIKTIGNLIVILNIVRFEEDNILIEKDNIKVSIKVPMHYILSEKEIEINILNIKTIKLKLDSKKLYYNIYYLENVFNDIPIYLKVHYEIPEKNLSKDEKEKLIKVMEEIYGTTLQLSYSPITIPSS